MDPKPRRVAPSVEVQASRLVRLGLQALRLPHADPVRGLGLQWYPLAQAHLLRVANEHGRAMEDVAGVVAALSPQVGWLDQLTHLDGFLFDTERGAHPGFDANREKARRIWDDSEPALDVLSGPKVRAFYAALTGDLSEAVIDRHAYRVACAGDPPPLTAKRYRDAVEAYGWAAGDLNVRPAVLQSLLWVDSKARAAEAEGKARSIVALGLGFTNSIQGAFRPETKREA